VYPLYNLLTTGNPWVPGYVKLWGPGHGLGFHETPWGDLHTPLAGLRNELVDLSLLNVFLFEWPVPSLLPLGLFLLAGWAVQPWDRRLVAGFLALPAVYFLYWHRDAFLGPRFLYAGLAFLIPLTARALCEGALRLRGRSLRAGAAVRQRRWPHSQASCLSCASGIRSCMRLPNASGSTPRGCEA
nr:hypothetical protein [Gemmatimonadota bacterium]